MDFPSEPTTAAGRAYLRRGGHRLDILAIEAQARADALREAAERVRGLWGGSGAGLTDVLAILTPETTP